MKKQHVLLCLLFILVNTSAQNSIQLTEANNPMGIKVYKNELYFTNGNNISKLNLANKNPELINVCSLLEKPTAIEIINDYLYIATTNKVVRFDLSNKPLNIEDIITGLEASIDFFTIIF